MFEVAAVLTQEGRGLLHFLRALDAHGAGELRVAPDSREDGRRLLAFRYAALEEPQRIAPALPACPLRVFALELNKLSRLVDGARSAPIWLLSLV